MAANALPTPPSLDIAVKYCILVVCLLIGSNPSPIRLDRPIGAVSDRRPLQRLGTTARLTCKTQQNKHNSTTALALALDYHLDPGNMAPTSIQKGDGPGFNVGSKSPRRENRRGARGSGKGKSGGGNGGAASFRPTRNGIPKLSREEKAAQKAAEKKEREKRAHEKKVNAAAAKSAKADEEMEKLTRQMEEAKKKKALAEKTKADLAKAGVPIEDLQGQEEAFEEAKIANAAVSKPEEGCWNEVQKRKHTSKKSKGANGEDTLLINDVNFPALESPKRKTGGGKKRVQTASPLPSPRRAINPVPVANPTDEIDLTNSPEASPVGATNLFDGTDKKPAAKPTSTATVTTTETGTTLSLAASKAGSATVAATSNLKVPPETIAEEPFLNASAAAFVPAAAAVTATSHVRFAMAVGQTTSATASSSTATSSAKASTQAKSTSNVNGADGDSINHYVEGGEMEQDLDEIRRMHKSLSTKIQRAEDAMDVDGDDEDAGEEEEQEVDGDDMWGGDSMHNRDAEDEEWEAAARVEGDDDSEAASESKEDAESEDNVESVTSRITSSTRTTQSSTASRLTSSDAPAATSTSTPGPVNRQDLGDAYDRAAAPASAPPAARPFEAAARFAVSIKAFRDRTSQQQPATATPAAHVTPGATAGGILRQNGTSAGPRVSQDLPPMEETTEEDMNLFKMATQEGAPGKAWYLLLSLLMQDGLSNKEVMLGGLAAGVQIMSAAIPDFKLHPLDKNSDLPFIISHLVEEGFPDNTALAQWYYKVKARRNFNQNSNSGGQAQTPVTPRPQQAQSKGYDDDAEYAGPNKMNGTIRVSGGVNIKEAIEILQMDLEDAGIDIRWKPHQSKESMTQVVIIGVPRVFCPHGTTEQICYYLKEMEKQLISKGKMDLNLIDKPLPQQVIGWRSQRKGKSRNRMEQRLSLNNIPGYKENGCWILSIEGAPEDWPRLCALWNLFWKSGVARTILGRRCKMVQVFSGGYSNTDRSTMQRLRRFHQTYSNGITVVTWTCIENLNKVVEVRMSARSPRPRPYKFTTLIKEIMKIKVEHNGEDVPAFQACIPVTQGLGAGSVRVTIKSDVKEALALADNIKKCPGGWFFGYWTQRCLYNTSCAQTLMESFDIEHAGLAKYSTFDERTLRVKAEFPEEDDFLEDVEAEWGLDAYADEPDSGGVQVDLANSREELANTLRERDDISMADGDAPSRATGHVDGQSAGNLSDRSEGSVGFGMNHKERAIQNVQLRRECAEKDAALAQKDAEMEQQVARAREEEQARHNEEVERIRAEARAEMERMRRQFEEARGVGSRGASPSAEDDPGKTTFGSGAGEC